MTDTTAVDAENLNNILTPLANSVGDTSMANAPAIVTSPASGDEPDDTIARFLNDVNEDDDGEEEHISPLAKQNKSAATKTTIPKKPTLKKSNIKKTLTVRSKKMIAETETETETEEEDDDDDDFVPETKLKKATPRRTPVKRKALTVDSDHDSEEVGSPAKKSKITPKTAKSRAMILESDDDSEEASGLAKKSKATLKPTKNKVTLKSKATSKTRATPKSKAMPLTGGRKRQPPEQIVEGRPLGRSYAECDALDKMIIDMVEAKNDWPAIRDAWKQRTGVLVAKSTLPNRYDRLLDNFTVINEEDKPILLEAKDYVEDQMAVKKWQLIADKMQELGGDKYIPAQIQRQWKIMMVKEGLRKPPGIVDPDWDIKLPEEYGEE